MFPKEKLRDSNIELLRALLAFFVIVLHFNSASMPGGGGASALISAGSIRYYVVQLTEALSCCAVNVFILISGYYMAEKREICINQVFSLFNKVVFYNLIFYYIIVYLKLENFDYMVAFYRTIPTNYFVLLYSVVYVFTPFITFVFDNLSESKMDLLIIMLFTIFSVEPTIVNIWQNIVGIKLVGVNTVAMEGDFAGYNIINFLMVFMIGIYIKRKGIFAKVKSYQWTLIYHVSALFILIFSHFTSVMFDYSNVLVIIEAVALFKAFESFNIPYNKIINSFGGAAFDIFLIHTNTLFLVYFWEKFKIAENYALLTFVKMVGFSMATTISMYLLCYLISLIYKLLFSKLIERYSNRKKFFIKV
ncbi:acyltransferase family protein [Clostridium boliviensis]|uniref:Acyltransferase family protein n=2 Tax=Clostridium boliviensis TaxID=318465 RepID=A0ABU4GPW8_9CLOT|nr:acyltransferase family protein [Clostridium boliviensis]